MTCGQIPIFDLSLFTTVLKRTAVLFLLIVITACSHPHIHTCALKGVRYNGINELPSLKTYWGKDVNTVSVDNGKYCLSLCSNGDSSTVLFEMAHEQPSGEIIYEILDSINAGASNQKRGIYLYGCELLNHIDYTIFASIKRPEDSNGNFEIINAWCADTINNIIVPITNLNGVTCKDVLRY